MVLDEDLKPLNTLSKVGEAEYQEILAMVEEFKKAHPVRCKLMKIFGRPIVFEVI